MQEAPVVDLEQSDPGTHLCAFYRNQNEMDQVAHAFVRSALAAGDRVLYVASVRSPRSVSQSLESRGLEAERAQAVGQLVVQSFDHVYGGARQLDFDELADGFRTAGRQARSDGFPGLRVAAEMGQFAQLVGSTKRLIEWERTATTLQAEEGITSVCQYDAAEFSAEEVSHVQTAHFGSAPLHSPVPLASFTVSRHPVGVRIVGEVDLSNRRIFERAMQACADRRSSFTVDVEGLEFGDVGFLEVIYRVAARLPEDGMIRVRNASDRFKRLVEIARFDDPRVVVA